MISYPFKNENQYLDITINLLIVFEKHKKRTISILIFQDLYLMKCLLKMFQVVEKFMSANQKKTVITSMIFLSSLAVDLCWGF